MKFLILHGTSADHSSNWFSWLKAELEKIGHEVWVPDLPDADSPNIQKYNQLLLNRGWDFNDCVIIGHSSGSVATLGVLSALPDNTKINTAILVGAFTKRLLESPSWEMLRQLFDKPFDFEALKQKAGKFIFLHSEDDPYCPIQEAEFLCNQLDGEFYRFKEMGHFSRRLDPRFNKFPELLEIIENRVLA